MVTVRRQCGQKFGDDWECEERGAHIVDEWGQV